jgi:DNA-binding transcriptional ArsR family regulator
VESILKVIAQPNRRQILRLIANQELSAGEIAANFEISRPAVSQHLSVLKEANLISERRRGTQRLYRARPEAIAELKDFLDDFWADRLERLKHSIEHQERQRKRRN